MAAIQTAGNALKSIGAMVLGLVLGVFLFALYIAFYGTILALMFWVGFSILRLMGLF